MSNIVFYNGNYLPESEVSIHFKDLGFLRAYGVFDYLRTYDTKPFLLEKHILRFLDSAQEMNIDVEHSQDELLSIISELLEKNEIREYGIKMLATGGVDGKPTLLIYFEDLDVFPETYYSKGVVLKTLKFKRNFARAKHTNYQEALKSRVNLSDDVFEILYISEGDQVLECSTSNIFMVKDSTIITPKENILLGATRDFVIELAHEIGYVVDEREILFDELKQADEVFITASKKEIMPVSWIDDVTFHNIPGEITQQLMKCFKEKINS